MVSVNFRLWSNDVAVGPLLEGIGLHAKYLHRKGHPMPKVITRSGAPPRRPVGERIAKRNYVSSEAVEVCTRQETLDAVHGILDQIARSPELADKCRSGLVEATLWVAELGDSPRVDLSLPEEFTVWARQLGVKLFVESLVS